MLVLIGESTVEPVDVTQLKTHLRMESTDSTAEDVLMRGYITAARKIAENITKRALVPSTWQLIIDDFENDTATIELPRPPLTTVSTLITITYVQDNTAGTTTSINSTVYTVDSDSEPGRLYPQYDSEWPDEIRDQRNAVTIQYASGYTTATCPQPIKNWILMRAANMYEFREPIVAGNILSEMNRSFVDGLLDPYKIVSIST